MMLLLRSISSETPQDACTVQIGKENFMIPSGYDPLEKRSGLIEKAPGIPVPNTPWVVVPFPTQANLNA